MKRILLLAALLLIIISVGLFAQPGYIDFEIEIYSVYHEGNAFLFVNNVSFPENHPNYWERVGDIMPFGAGTTIHTPSEWNPSATLAKVAVYHYLRREEQIKPIVSGINYFYFEFLDMIEDPTPPITP